MTATAKDPPIKCSYDSLVALAELRPNPSNPNKHPNKQIGLLAKNIADLGWRHPIIVSNLSGMIVVGHARLEAAQKLGCTVAPVDYQDFESEAEELAYLLADNRIAELAEIDTELVRALIDKLDESDIDLDLTGFDESARDDLDGSANPYTNKITTPVYEPKGACPKIEELFDRSKTARLIDEINASDIPEDVAEFLRLAAERHTAFHFGRIAEFYCHASADVQDLMEKSGMVIIDFNKAVEYGFVHMTERLGELAGLELAGEDGNESS